MSEPKSRFMQKMKKVWPEIWDLIKCVVITAAVTFLVTRLLFPVAMVPTGSMENEIPTGSFVFCSKVSYWGDKTPQRGDVILFRRSVVTNDDTLYTKRIVGLPGETVEIKNGVTYINGEVYNETWLKETPNDENFGPYIVPTGNYFCMGDNRNNSYDCRYWEEHYIPESRIVAKCQFVVSEKRVGLIEDNH